MKSLLAKVKGKKTYIVAVATIVYALVVVGWSMGEWNQASLLILGSLGLGGVRDAMNK